MVGDFNCDFAQRGVIINSPTGNKLQHLLLQVCLCVANDQPTRVTGSSSTLIDLIITNKGKLIKNSKTLDLGISDHKLVYAEVQTKIRRPPPKIVKARSFKHFDTAKFQNDIETAPWSVCSTFDDPNDNYWAWCLLFDNICNENAPYREIKLRSESLPWISPQIRHLMNQRFKTLRKAKETDNPELWTLYRRLRNQVTHDVRLAKSKYYRELFDVVKDSRSYWKLVRNATNANKASPIVGIRGTDGKLETSDVTKAEILNEHFSSIGERLAKDLPALNTDNVHTYITQVSPFCWANI